MKINKILIIMMFLLVPFVFAFNGAGVILDPWQLNNCSDLLLITDSNDAYKIMQNINCENHSIKFIGDGTFTTFYGDVDGNHKTISNMHYDNLTSNFAGLFRVIQSPFSIYNLTLNNTNYRASQYIGAIAGIMKTGYIRDIYINNITIFSNAGWIGGLIGQTQNINQIHRIYVNGSISTGGVYDYCGGITGEKQAGIINTCVAHGSIDCDVYVGGLVGKNAGNVYDSYADMTILNYTDLFNNALLGSHGSGTLTRSYSIDPNLFPTITGVTVGNSYYDADIRGNNSYTEATPKTTAQMKQQSTFPTWDFINIWQMNNGSTYPSLRLEGALPVPQSPPVGSNFTYPEENTVHNKNIIFTWINFTDVDGDFNNYSIRIFNWTDLEFSVNNIMNSVYILNSSLISDGFHTIKVIGFDDLGQNDTISLNFYTDNTPPFITISYPNKVYGGNALNGTVTQANLSTITTDSPFFVRNLAVALPLFSFSYINTVSFNDNISVIANDTLNNIQILKKYIIFDIINPECTGISSQSLRQNRSYNWNISCVDDVLINSFNITCIGGTTFDYYINNISNSTFNFLNETGNLTSDARCNITIKDGFNNSNIYFQRFTATTKEAGYFYFNFDLSQLTNVLIFATLIFVWLACLTIGMVFKNFGFASFGFFIGIFNGLILSGVHIVLTLIFLLMNFSLWFASAKAMKE